MNNRRSSNFLHYEFSYTGTTLSQEEESLSTLNVFPNPIRRGENLKVEGLTEFKEATLVNTQGQTVFVYHEVDSGELIIPSQLPSGLYTLYISSNNTITYHKLVIE